MNLEVETWEEWEGVLGRGLGMKGEGNGSNIRCIDYSAKQGSSEHCEKAHPITRLCQSST